MPFGTYTRDLNFLWFPYEADGRIECIAYHALHCCKSDHEGEIALAKPRLSYDKFYVRDSTRCSDTVFLRLALRHRSPLSVPLTILCHRKQHDGMKSHQNEKLFWYDRTVIFRSHELTFRLGLGLRSVSTTRVHGPSSRAELTARELGCIF